MARKTITTLTDDVDGSQAERTLTFSLDGTSYEIDLSQKNIDALATALAPFITAGTKVSGKTRTAKSVGSGTDLVAVRAWAREQGMEISNRGRVSKDIMKAYTQRQKD